MRNRTILGLIIFIMNISLGYSQISNPVTITTTLTPPYSTFLSDYSSIGSNKLIASILFNDLNEPSWNVRLKINNIDIAGISLSELQTNGKLPQGFYTFCIEVYDYNSNRLLSNKSCVGALLQLNDIPLVQNPFKGEVIKIIDPINILFQWQLSTPTFNSNPLSTEFQFSLYKILDKNGRNEGKAFLMTLKV